MTTAMSDEDYLVRLRPPAKGDTIHRSTCRYAKAGKPVRWRWADEHPDVDWLFTAPWLHRCLACLPPTPFRSTGEGP